jgi:hypothetical protein
MKSHPPALGEAFELGGGRGAVFAGSLESLPVAIEIGVSVEELPRKTRSVEGTQALISCL